MARGFRIAVVVLALAVPVTATATGRAPSGSLSIEGGRGTVVVKGSGGIIGRVDAGSVQIVDQTPNDRWAVIVNGIARPRGFAVRGANVNFRLLGGQYRVTIRGEGIAIAARGRGVASLTGEPDEFGFTGLYAAGDDGAACRAGDGTCLPLPLTTTRVRFGPPEPAPAPVRSE